MSEGKGIKCSMVKVVITKENHYNAQVYVMYLYICTVYVRMYLMDKVDSVAYLSLLTPFPVYLHDFIIFKKWQLHVACE